MELTRVEIFRAMNGSEVQNVKDLEGQYIIPVAYHAHEYEDPDGKIHNVLVIKDSFGNAMAPFFTQNYHTVYVVDYRYYSKNLSTLVNSFEIDDIIFLPNVSDIQTQAVSNLLQKYSK